MQPARIDGAIRDPFSERTRLHKVEVWWRWCSWRLWWQETGQTCYIDQRPFGSASPPPVIVPSLAWEHINLMLADTKTVRAQEPCEGGGGRPGLRSLMAFMD